ncbi:MAG: hypothetical protein JWL77_5123 [Chthonomonadaceae bacterium]|nr:hypothetical protein [Chthonomonadaceae bacterium]
MPILLQRIGTVAVTSRLEETSVSLFSLRSLKRAFLTVGVLSLLFTRAICAEAQRPGWLPAPLTGDDPYGDINHTSYGIVHYNGYNYKIEYVATNTTTALTTPIQAPLVSLTSSGVWGGFLNTSYVGTDMMYYSPNYYYLDNGNEAFSGYTGYHGPFSTDGGQAGGTESHTLRSVMLEVDSSSWSQGSVDFQAQNPFVIYKITCLNPPSGVSQFGIILKCVQGEATGLSYVCPTTDYNMDIFVTATATSAAGSVAHIDYQWVYGSSSFPNPGPDPDPHLVLASDGTSTVAQTTPLFGSVNMYPAAGGTFVGYFSTNLNPRLTVTVSGNPGEFAGIADWELVPFAVTDGP